MPKIIDTDNPNYIAYCKNFHQGGRGFHNGAYYYSREIVKNIIPNVKTTRPWDTLGMKFLGSFNHAIVFLHNNKNPEKTYSWLNKYQDLIYICSSKASLLWAMDQPNGDAIFLPLSVDVDYVKQFKTKKTKDVCYAGNRWRFKEKDLAKYIPDDVDFPPKDLPREELLKFIAPYKTCYAIGRCAIEASVLGCKVKNCDHRYDGVEWPVLDNKDAAKALQSSIDRIDNPHDKPNSQTCPSQEPYR